MTHAWFSGDTILHRHVVSVEISSLACPCTPLLPPPPPLCSNSTQTRWQTCWISAEYSGPGYSGNLVCSTRAATWKTWAAWAETSTKPSSWITLLPPTSSTLIMLWVPQPRRKLFFKRILRCLTPNSAANSSHFQWLGNAAFYGFNIYSSTHPNL